MKRNPITLKKETTALLIIDLQERIPPVIGNYETVLENTVKLIKGFEAMRLPIYFIEQYPKGLGPTSQKILDELEGYTAYQKMSFSCSGAENLFEEFHSKKFTQIVVCGVESHVCVQQTVLDLIPNDYRVDLALMQLHHVKKLITTLRWIE